MAHNFAATTALIDIQQELDELGRKKNFGTNDTWIVIGIHLYNKEQRELNRRLGVHAVNKANNLRNLEKIS